MGVVAIVLLAVIGFNFEDITGNAVKDLAPSVTIYPTDVNAGEKVNIKIRPNNVCVDPEIGLYFSGVKSDSTVDTGSNLRQAVITQKGGFSICKNSKGILDPDGTFTLSYKTELNWDGDYFAKIFYWKDRKTKESINVYFSVNPKTT